MQLKQAERMLLLHYLYVRSKSSASNTHYIHAHHPSNETAIQNEISKFNDDMWIILDTMYYLIAFVKLLSSCLWMYDNSHLKFNVTNVLILSVGTGYSYMYFVLPTGYTDLLSCVCTRYN